MKPKKNGNSNQPDLFNCKLVDMINMNHPLVILANKINWDVFDEHFDHLYDDVTGRPALPNRLMVGIHLLKYAFNVSDEKASEIFLENPYWQYFCGFEYFQHTPPFDRSSMSKWRKRVRHNNIDKLLTELLEVAKQEKLVLEKDFKNVVVDTTVQEKAVTFPTDCKLYYKSIVRLSKLCKEVRLPLRQSFIYVAKKESYLYGRLIHARQFKRANKHKRKLRTYLGRLIRDIDRKLVNHPHFENDELITILERAKRIYWQQKNDRNKLYSLHEPDVECISKGKSHKKYEFGNKVSIVTTAKNCWIIGVQSLRGNPYDGSTLRSSIAHSQRISGVCPSDVFVDQGYRGSIHHPEGVNVNIVDRKFWKKRRKIAYGKRRSSVEPVIGHLKIDHRMGRNFLKGIEGDASNAIFACCGFNMRKLLRAIARFFILLKISLNMTSDLDETNLLLEEV